MSWRRHIFNSMYRVGRPIWSTPVPPEIRAVVEGERAWPPGRALDLGCGTSGNVRLLAQHGWDATGVDFSGAAIRRAEKDADGVAGATFIEADVTALTEVGITGPFDLVIDNGCFHTLSAHGKRAYVAQVAAVMPAGATLLMWEGIHIGATEIVDLFSNDFVVEDIKDKAFTIEHLKRQIKKAKWYTLRRR